MISNNSSIGTLVKNDAHRSSQVDSSRKIPLPRYSVAIVSPDIYPVIVAVILSVNTRGET